MHNKPQFRNPLSRSISRVATLVLTIVFVLALILIFTQPAQAQTFKVLYTFTGQADGGMPYAGVTMDSAGTLYGTTSMGGYTGGSCGLSRQLPGCGTVYKLSQQGSAWTFNALYAFRGAPDGAYPWARVIIGPDGGLFGTTVGGGKALAGWTSGQSSGYGTVFNLNPPSKSSSPWSETVLYRFQGGDDGAGPTTGDLTFDPAGVIYGTTDGISGRYHGATTVYQLSHSDGVWTKNTLHRFTGGTDGSCTQAGVVFDKAGNLYGVTCFGGDSLGGVCGSLGCGTVFQLTPSGDGWAKTILYSFQGGSDGAYPSGGLIIDAAGNLYGTTLMYGSGYGGTVFMLSPSNGTWTFNLLHGFTGGGDPAASLVMDAAGNLYGTTTKGGAYGHGTVFKLTRSSGGYVYRSLHDFTGNSDGANSGSLVLDANGDLYGTAQLGGNRGSCSGLGCGTIWEITP